MNTWKEKEKELLKKNEEILTELQTLREEHFEDLLGIHVGRYYKIYDCSEQVNYIRPINLEMNDEGLLIVGPSFIWSADSEDLEDLDPSEMILYFRPLQTIVIPLDNLDSWMEDGEYNVKEMERDEWMKALEEWTAGVKEQTERWDSWISQELPALQEEAGEEVIEEEESKDEKEPEKPEEKKEEVKKKSGIIKRRKVVRK